MQIHEHPDMICEWCKQPRNAKGQRDELLEALDEIARMAESLCEPAAITNKARALIAKVNA